MKWAWLVLALALSVESCFSPNYLSGKTACSPSGDCPASFQCVAGLCYANGDQPPGDMGMDMSSGRVCTYDQDDYDSGCVFAP